jgi:hypothetical protein
MAHVLVGMALAKLTGWWMVVLGPASHFVLDWSCWFHPPGMEWPWGPRRGLAGLWDRVQMVVLDEWQYPGPAMESWTGFAVGTDTTKKVLWVMNSVGAAVAVWVGLEVPGGWWLVAAGLWSWLSFDVWWAVRMWWPAGWAAIGRWNPHLVVDWWVRRTWGSRHDVPWAASWEVVCMLAPAVWLVVTG